MRITIIGLGLMGASLGLAVRKSIPGAQVTGFDTNAAQGATALRGKCVERISPDLAGAVSDVELLILAVPPSAIAGVIEAAVPHLPPAALVTDLTSTKRSVLAAARRSLPRGVAYVGSHPMVGSEASGPENARADLFARGLTLLIVEPDTPPAAAVRLDKFWHDLGMRTTRLGAADHDRLVAAVSHLPHALATALVRIQEPAALQIAGRGFRDLTRIAAGSPALWRDILSDNADHLRAAIGQLRGELDHLEKLLDPARAADLEAWLAAAASARREMDGKP
jgi:prephenate dehydrogenase